MLPLTGLWHHLLDKNALPAKKEILVYTLLDPENGRERRGNKKTDLRNISICSFSLGLSSTRIIHFLEELILGT